MDHKEKNILDVSHQLSQLSHLIWGKIGLGFVNFIV